MHVAVVAGNPRPNSRTLTAAAYVARELAGEPDLVVDLADLAVELIDWQSAVVAELVESVGKADLVVFASPTYKGAYTGLLKLFLDRFPAATGLRGLAVPLMLGGGPAHALAPELTLRPILTELGATVPGRGLFILDSAYADPEAYAGWLAQVRSIVAAWEAHSSTPKGP
ncbi:MAG: NAD(P)H-dependent oxidoreductase [Nocardioidaceae bacterium]